MKKSAILFGINSYHVCPLKNAANDASALSEKLTELGFETKCFIDVDSATMERELVAFRADLEQSSVGLFFFAGHGIQCKGENFLATTSTSFVDESSCKYTAIALNLVIDIFEESKVNTKIIILDACRDNPFITWRSAANSGLAPVCAPKGTIIAFSTSPGQKASDGLNDHGVYTNALLTHIATKNLSIEDMFKRVRNTVSSHTGHNQITWEHTSLMGTFYFNSGIDTEEARPIYAPEALADQDYSSESNDEIQDIIDRLKTYNWYQQNPAISQISRLDFAHADKDDLFVLGRNIYQTACGGSCAAERWMENIETNLSNIGGNAAIHLLNGILFEIHFNYMGKIRANPKADYYEKPVKLCQKKEYVSCGSFIKNYLEQYPQYVRYIPGTPDLLTIDILIAHSDIGYHIDGVCIDGLSCMYDKDSSGPYVYDGFSYAYREMTIRDITTDLCCRIAVPKNMVKFTCNIKIPNDSSVLVPLDFTLLRYIP